LRVSPCISYIWMVFQTMDLIPRYAKITPVDPSLEFVLPSEPSDPLNSTDEFDFPSTLVIFTETKSLDLISRFRKDADAYYVEAKRSTVSSIAQIPYWMYGVLVVLGWNEAMVVLFNPLYFTFTLMGLVTSCVYDFNRLSMESSLDHLLLFSYIIMKLGLTGPLFQLSKTVLVEVCSIALFCHFSCLMDHDCNRYRHKLLTAWGTTFRNLF
jgi:hypothetical protein